MSARQQAGAADGAPSGAVTIAIKDLVRSRDFQVRERMCPTTVGRYASIISTHETEDVGTAKRRTVATVSPLPPIRVAMVGGAPVVVDGWHRIAAHERCGLTDILAIITPDVAEEDARWMAAAANMQHGLPLTTRELRVAFKAFVKAGQHIIRPAPGTHHRPRFKSYADITRDFGGQAGRTTIQQWMKLDFPHIARAMGAVGGHTPGEPRKKDPEAAAKLRALEAICQMEANAKGITNGGHRGQLIGAVEDALKRLRGAGAWHPSEF